MLLSQLKKEFITALSDEYPDEEAGSFFTLLAEAHLGMTRLETALNPDRPISRKEQQKFQTAIRRLLQHEPVQYIIGETYFYGLRFKVNDAVLIPRPETEELVDWVLEDTLSFPGTFGLEILDIGTGSGCIAVSIANRLPQASVSALDISGGALETARENAKLNNAAVNFFRADVLQLESLGRDYNIIISNPPYVRELEKRQMQRNVLEHEPERALYVKDEDPLIFYRKITKLAKEAMDTGGKLYFEINQYLSAETGAMVEEQGFAVELRKDMFGNFRMLKAIKKP